jgi:hypothetical protein
VIHADPIPPLNVEKLMRIIVAQPFRIRRREVSLLALRYREQAVRLLNSGCHTETLQ